MTHQVAPRSRHGLWLVSVFLLGVAVGVLLHATSASKGQQAERVRLERRYPKDGELVNPLIRVETPPSDD